MEGEGDGGTYMVFAHELVLIGAGGSIEAQRHRQHESTHHSVVGGAAGAGLLQGAAPVHEQRH